MVVYLFVVRCVGFLLCPAPWCVWVLSTGLASHAAARLYSSRTSALSQPSTNSIVGCQNNPDTSSQQSAEVNQAGLTVVGLFLMKQNLP